MCVRVHTVYFIHSRSCPDSATTGNRTENKKKKKKKKKEPNRKVAHADHHSLNSPPIAYLK